jgi:uncharacterized phage protein (TIGR01671 family)
MREIKFRAWVKDPLDRGNERMVYEANTIRIGLDGQIYFGRDFNGRMTDISTSHLVLMQWTGLFDRNGKPIFEGDILDYPKWVVAYCGDVKDCLEMDCGWYIQRDDFESWTELECKTTYEIIGNIYENPELLKEPLK